MSLGSKAKSVSPALWVGAVLLVLGVWVWSSFSPRPTGKRVTVLAASSLTPSFEALKAGFEAQYPQTQVELVFAGSQILRMQVQAGAPGDVIASAHPEHLAALGASGHAGQALPLAQNRLAIVVAPQQVAPPWQELARLQSWITGSPDVPLGRYTQALLTALSHKLGAQAIEQLRSQVKSEEPNARMVKAKIEMGQAQAAVVYASDLSPGTLLKEVVLPRELQIQAHYAIAPLTSSPELELAQRFIAYARSEAGQLQLQKAGLLPIQGAGCSEG